ncbi:DUF456 domain-containing protein [Prochlorococcus marinus]|uniref:DUF456 domain-containing protein n=1 Tax=Prochlorococcus TaxID=1218 RepID=UPI0007B34143|nr:DUF456 domain-containing protein [Prochlorococcus marinus]KZR74494.1 hypothetical protein PMIT1323_02458 [Prochlorococcus marinus str. MIT 1323]
MPADPIWWWAVGVQLLALPGALFPVLPSLLWLPLGAGLWVWHVGWSAGWLSLGLACIVFFLGLIADLLAVALASARLRASRWAVLGAGLGLLLGLVGLLPALPFGGPLLGALFGPWLGAALVETLTASQPPLALGWLLAARRGALVGLAVVAGLLVSRVAQFVLALLGIAGFLLLSWA